MKKLILLALCALMLLLLGCGKNDPAVAPDAAGRPAENGDTANDQQTSIVLDFKAKYGCFSDEQIFEHNGVLYYLFGLESSPKIYYCDIESKDWLPLCGRPDCYHRGGECNAFLEGGTLGYKMWPYGDHIYYIVENPTGYETKLCLWRMKLDGSDHERLSVISFSDEFGRFGASTYCWFFHNKYALIWFAGTNSLDDDAPFKSFCGIIDLSAEHPKMKRSDMFADFGAPLAGDGDTLYTISNRGNVIYRLDLDSETATEICSLPFFVPEGCAALKDGKLYLCAGYGTSKAICLDPETREYTEITGLSDDICLLALDDCILQAGADHQMGGRTDPDGQGTLIYGFDGKLIRHIPYESYSVNIYPIWATDKYVFGFETQENGDIIYETTPQWYLDLSEIDSDDMTWHRWSPED